jgi:hypothetical protein
MHIPLIQPRSDAVELDRRGHRRAQVIGADHRVALEQVVRPHPRAQEAAKQRAQALGRRVDAAQQHRLVADRHAVIDQALARGAGLGRQLLGVVEVRVDEQRRVAAQHRAQLVVDAHRAHHRDAGADADGLEVRDGAQPREDAAELLGGHEQRIAAGDEHVADARRAREVGQAGVEIAGGGRRVAADEAAAVAVPAVDRAAIDHQEQRAIGVLVDHARRRVMAVLAQRIAQLLGADVELGGARDGLHAHRAGRIARVHQARVVRRDADAEQVLRAGQPVELGGREVDDLGQLVGAGDHVAELPAPALPVARRHVGLAQRARGIDGGDDG